MRLVAYACALTTVALAPPWQYTAQAQDWLREAIPLEARLHDFGTVARAAKTEHRFLIKNNSAEELHLRSVRASCGCTTPIIETEWIKPGETGSILARFNTGTFTGRKSATLTVSIDKPTYTELQLNVKGYIRSDVVLNPGEINFGEVPVGEPKKLEMSLDYAGRSDWKLTDVESPLDFLDVQIEEVARGGGRVSYKIAASLAADAPLGAIQNQVLLKTNDRNLTSVPVRMMATVQPPVQVSPQSLALGSVAPEQSVSQRLILKGRRDFRVLAITSPHADIRFEGGDAAKQAHLLNIAIVPKLQPQDGVVDSEVLVETDLMDESIRIPFSFSQLTNDAASSVVQAD